MVKDLLTQVRAASSTILVGHTKEASLAKVVKAVEATSRERNMVADVQHHSARLASWILICLSMLE